MQGLLVCQVAAQLLVDTLQQKNKINGRSICKDTSTWYLW